MLMKTHFHQKYQADRIVIYKQVPQAPEHIFSNIVFYLYVWYK